jgi:hypothetical protein
MAPVWRWKSSWRVRLLAMMRSSGASAAMSSAGGAAGFRGGFFRFAGFDITRSANGSCEVGARTSRSEPPHPNPLPSGEREFACASPGAEIISLRHLLHIAGDKTAHLGGNRQPVAHGLVEVGADFVVRHELDRGHGVG